MIYAVSAFAALAAVLHVFIFYLEAFAWASPLARKIFGPQAPDELKITKFYAYNQGIYNLALAIIAFAGAIMLVGNATGSGNETADSGIGVALVFAGCGSMLLAALALGIASPRHRAAAVKQGVLPLLAVLCSLILCL